MRSLYEEFINCEERLNNELGPFFSRDEEGAGVAILMFLHD